MAKSIAPVAFNFNSHEVRTIHKDNVVWFVASDIAKSLNYAEAKDMVRHLDEDETGRHTVPIRSENGTIQDREVLLINESGLYHALFKSRKKEAQAFRKWVTSEVLPTIRKTGEYSTVKPKKTTKALPFCLTAEQQMAIQALVKSRVELLPREQQAKATITCWSALKSKFGVSYKEIPEEYYIDALNLISRLDIEPALFIDQKINDLYFDAPSKNLEMKEAYLIIRRISMWAQKEMPNRQGRQLITALEEIERILVRAESVAQEAAVHIRISANILSTLKV